MVRTQARCVWRAHDHKATLLGGARDASRTEIVPRRRTACLLMLMGAHEPHRVWTVDTPCHLPRQATVAPEGGPLSNNTVTLSGLSSTRTGTALPAVVDTAQVVSLSWSGARTHLSQRQTS